MFETFCWVVHKNKLDVFICVVAMPVSMTLSAEKGAFKITR